LPSITQINTMNILLHPPVKNAFMCQIVAPIQLAPKYINTTLNIV